MAKKTTETEIFTCKLESPAVCSHVMTINGKNICWTEVSCIYSKPGKLVEQK